MSQSLPLPTDLPGASGATVQEPLEISPDMLDTAPVRVDFERGMAMAPVALLVLIAGNVAVYAWELMSGALDSTEAIIAAGALHRESVLDGQWWRTLTAIYLHGSIDHLVGNMLMLYVLGIGVQHGAGWWRMLAAYHLAGLVGSILSVVMSPGPSVGASGAIFGLAGVMIVFLYRHQHRFQLRDKRVGFVLLIWAAWSVGIGFLDTGIDNFAHIGGFVGGAVIGAFLPARNGATTDERGWGRAAQ